MKTRSIVLVALLIAISSAAQGQVLRTDFDSSGKVDFDDFLLFVSAFNGSDAVYDLDADGRVNFPDFLLFVADFGKRSESAVLAWTQVTPSSAGPVGRLDHTMILDIQRNRFVLFGGKTLEELADTWVFDLASSAWSEAVTPTAPQPRRGHGVVYDRPRDRMVIYGGEGTSGFFTDVWAFDLETDTWSEVETSGGPPVPRYGLATVLDSTRDRMVISHGFSSQGRFDDTWAFDLDTHGWTELTPSSGPVPLKRCLQDATLDEANGRMLMYGGCSSGFGPCPQGDIWAFDLAGNTWVELTPEESPSARRNPSLIQLPGEGEALMFGGFAASSVGDLWRFRDDLWEQVEAQGEGPSSRWSHDVTLDVENRRMYLFGGTNGADRFNDLWRLDY